ncbi:phosphotransferase [Nocardioides acrostichi]|uniref:Phosphotransferase n=1 Tax=Nocardioides acrostichi TaxID=2784339 RepID=A0A930YCB9_9ACTN|nr:phosphotransferase [Nocardioides acrostichi]MBF4163328.1 phosphotransferase [Nocardioides acrostichi]
MSFSDSSSLAFPHGRTSRRVEWTHLPPGVRAKVEARLGTQVVDARSATTGYTPGMASVLTGADGSRTFVKAAATVAQRQFADAYRQEAERLRSLPSDVPAPRLLWSLDGDWVVLGIEHVEARHPRRPWLDEELDTAMALMVDLAQRLTPAPASMRLVTLAEDVADLPAAWNRITAASVGRVPHDVLADATALAARLPDVGVGDTALHTDVRDDNLLLTDDGRVLLCDWNWPCRGPAWFDALSLLIGPAVDGHDAEAVLARTPLLADAPSEDVDTMLAVLTGYFLTSAELPVPTNSPHLRESQRLQGDACWDWLAQRRGW